MIKIISIHVEHFLCKKRIRRLVEYRQFKDAPKTEHIRDVSTDFILWIYKHFDMALNIADMESVEAKFLHDVQPNFCEEN